MWIYENVIKKFFATKERILSGHKVSWNSIGRGKMQGYVQKIVGNLAKIHTDFTPSGGYLSFWIELKHLKRI